MVSDINKLGLDVKWQDLTLGCTIVGSCTAEVFRTGERLSPGHRMCAGCGATIAVRNVLRGLHFQINYPQDKLVRVVSGEVFDVAVDLREGSATYGQWYGVLLSAENKKQFFIPKNFAHGFVVLSDTARRRR